MRRKLLFSIFIISSFLTTRAVFAYDDKTTHPALTDEAVDLYNINSETKLTNEEKEWIVSGSILEDTEPRYVNHFYDPIYKTGWSGEAGIIPQETMQKLTDIAIAPLGAVSALNWVHNQELQAKYERYLGNKTWEKAIYEYVKNKNKQEAYLALGHVLHLLEDMAVPEHTRNDTHTPLNESPYESYASRYNRDNINVIKDIKDQNPSQFNSLDEYFEELANYSNNYFFSRDTINDEKYDKPEIIREDNNYAYGSDRNGEFKLVLIDKKWNSEKGDYDKLYLLDKNEPSYYPILESYWTRLSRASVLNGAGVIRLFFEEVEKVEKDPSLLKPPPENQSAMLSLYGEIFKIKTVVVNVANAAIDTGTKIIDKISNLLDKYVIATGQPAAIILPSTTLVDVPAAPPAAPRVADETAEVGPSQTPQTTTVVGSSAQNTDDVRDLVTHMAVFEQKPIESKPAPASAPFTPSLPYPGFGGGSPASSQAAAIPRVAELPPPVSAQEEEPPLLPPLPSPPPQDITAPDPPVIVFPSDFSPAFTSADISFSGAAEASSTVSNDFNNSTTTADANGLWSLSFSFSQGSTTIKFFSEDAAGNVSGSTDVSIFIDSISPTIQTFSIAECANSLSSSGCLIATTSLHLLWQSLAGDLDYFELTNNGQTSTTTATSTVVSVSDNSANTFSIRAKDISGNWSNSPSQAVEILLMPVVINEVAWAGTLGHAQDEWIELYNRASQQINFENWILYSGTDGKPYIKLSGQIPAKGYYLIERTGDDTISDIQADWFGSFGASQGGGSGLSNNGEVLILAYASTTIDQTATMPNGRWPAGDEYGITMERYDPVLIGNDINSWTSNNRVIKNGKSAGPSIRDIDGTPKARNSANYLINKNNSNISSSITLTKSNSPYLVDNVLMTVGAAATLTIEPGVTIKFYNDAGFSVFGKIISQGTETEPIVFESFDDNYWYGVDVFAGGSVFDYSIFRKGGKYYNGTGKSAASLFIKDFPATITNSIFEYSKVYGLKLENSNSTVFNNIVRYNNNETDPAGYNAGLTVLSGSSSIQSNTFQNNRRGIYSSSPLATINANSFSSNTQEAILSSGVPANFTNNSGSGNTVNGIFLSSGDIAQAGATTTLKANPLPYAFDSGLNIPFNSGLVIESGVVANATGGFFGGGRLDVYGNLVFNGANSGDIVFSSGSVPPAPGWQGIRVYGNSNIKGVTFKHADKAIAYYNSPIKLENIKFESNNLAVYADGASAGQTIYGGESITALLIEFINQIATTSPSGLW